VTAQQLEKESKREREKKHQHVTIFITAGAEERRRRLQVGYKRLSLLKSLSTSFFSSFFFSHCTTAQQQQLQRCYYCSCCRALSLTSKSNDLKILASDSYPFPIPAAAAAARVPALHQLLLGEDGHLYYSDFLLLLCRHKINNI